MLIKEADDRGGDIAALTELLRQARDDGRTRQRIEQEIRNIQAGVAAEREAAREIDFYYGSSPKYAVIHDLRLDVDGRVAQIDHLLIARFLVIWVCETKHFAEGVGVNELGEWMSYWKGQERGIRSPIEQNRKHQAVLKDVFERESVRRPRRFGVTVKPELRGLVLVSTRAKITRPSGGNGARVEGLESVIKTDQMDATVQRQMDGILDATGTIRAMVRLLSSSALREFGQQLAALHKPIANDWAARFGIETPLRRALSEQHALTFAEAPTAGACALCHAPVSQRVAAYCAGNATRLGDRILCYKCQRRPAVPGSR